MRKRTVPFRMSLLGLAMLALAGCQNNNQMPLAAQGAAAGAASGALLGALLGGNNRGQGAAIGALLGAGMGAVAGSALANQQQGFAGTEQNLTGREVDARAVAQQLQDEAGSAQDSAQRISGEIRWLQREANAGRGLNAQQAQMLNLAKQDRDRAQAALNQGRTQLGQMRQQMGQSKGQGVDVSGLEAEAARIERSNASLGESLRRMNQDLGRIEI